MIGPRKKPSMPDLAPVNQTLDPAETAEPQEAAMIAEILAAMRGLVAKHYGDRPQRRGAHAKAHGLLRAEFRVLADINPELRHGVFAIGHPFGAWIRGSSTPDAMIPDRMPNVLGFALKIEGVEGATDASGSASTDQDFVLISANIVPFGTIKSFRDMIVGYAEGTGMAWFNNPQGPERAKITAEIVSNHPNFLGGTFYSTTPARLGPHVVKLRVRPLAPIRGTNLDLNDHLRLVTAETLESGPVTLELAVQRQRDPVAQPVEDASIPWSEADCPFETVAHIVLPQQQFNTAEQDRKGESMRFDPWNTRPEHRPLGGLNRIRRIVYPALARERVPSLSGPVDCLPADDPAPATREANVALAREIFQYDPNKLPPLQMCLGAPDGCRPSLGWVLTAGVVASYIGLNVLANKAEHLRAALPDWLGHPLLTAGEHEVDRVKGHVDAFRGALARWESGEEDPATIPLPAGFADHESLRRMVDTKVRGALTGATGHALSLFEEACPLYLYKSPGGEMRGTSVRDHDALYRELPTSPAAGGLDEDRTFARRRLTGPNGPFLRATAKLPEGMRVSEEQLQAAYGPLGAQDGDTLAKAAEEGRLFVADFGGMKATMPEKIASDGTHLRLFTPRALFAAAPGGGPFVPVAIEVDGAGTATAGVADGWRWRMAKYAVESAEIVYFEAVTHLGHTHLLLEPVALATVRQLAPNHPIARLVLPHVEGTISVNDMAVNHLLADGGAVDQTFAATMASIRSAAAGAMIAHDLRADTLPNRLARQGLCNREVLPVHPYRDDSLRVYGAVSRWVQAYVQHVYGTNERLQADKELQAWAADLGKAATAGGVTGFGTLRCLEDLSIVLTEFVFTASAGHAAVNFPQWTDASYAPRMSGAGWNRDAPESEAGWLSLMPSMQKSELHAEFLYLLGQLYYTRLGQYADPADRRAIWFRDQTVREGLLPAFQADLVQIEADINAANTDGSRAEAYTHLLPSKIPQSINV